MNLPDLIDLSKTSKLAEAILDEAVNKVFGERKPLTEVLDRLEKTDNRELNTLKDSL